jgi:hypothetical protein
MNAVSLDSPFDGLESNGSKLPCFPWSSDLHRLSPIGLAAARGTHFLPMEKNVQPSPPPTSLNFLLHLSSNPQLDSAPANNFGLSATQNPFCANRCLQIGGRIPFLSQSQLHLPVAGGLSRLSRLPTPFLHCALRFVDRRAWPKNRNHG